MTKAFTHLCKKINISIYDDAITIYQVPSTQLMTCLELLFLLVFGDELEQFFKHRSKELGTFRYVFFMDENHARYHQDNLYRKHKHVHLQYENTIDATRLNKILEVFEKYNIISSLEHENILNAFRLANEFSEKKDKSLFSLGFTQFSQQSNDYGSNKLRKRYSAKVDLSF